MCRKFLAARAMAAKIDKKPFVIEEFGKYISRPATSDAEIKALRDPWIEDIVKIANQSQSSGGPIVGERSQPHSLHLSGCRHRITSHRHLNILRLCGVHWTYFD